MINHNAPRASQEGEQSTNPADDGDWGHGASSSGGPQSADTGSTRSGADSEAEVHQSHALVPHRRQIPVLRPEVIIEIPAPVNRTRRFLWLGALAVPLIITLIALSALAIRSESGPATAQEGTVEARVSMRLTEEWSKNQPQYAATAALEATVEARVALRLEEERAIRAQQQLATASAAGESTVGLATATVAVTPAAAEGAPLYARSSAVLNLRRGPGQTYESLGLIPPGERLRLLGRTVDSGWFYVAKTVAFSTEEELGWVAGWLVDVPGDPMLLEVVSPNPLATQRE